MTLTEFYDLLKLHDWSFNYSDDHRHWTKGRDQLDHIQRLLKANTDNPAFKNLFEEYRTWFWDATGDVVKPERPE